MNNYIDINRIYARFKELTCTKVEDKYLVVNPKNIKQIQKILDEMNVVIDVYSQPYCDTDKIYLVDKMGWLD